MKDGNKQKYKEYYKKKKEKKCAGIRISDDHELTGEYSGD